ncbi:MAG: hypothetical protein ABI083_08155 [Lapillicoccus sp.]
MNTTDLGLGELLDRALGDEIVLVGDLVVAAAACVGHMCPSDVDAALGLDHRAA